MIMKAVPTEMVDGAWSRVAPLLRQFRSKYGDAPTLGQTYDLLQEGHRQLYVVMDGRDLRAVIITAISADKKRMEVPCVAGDNHTEWAGPVLHNLEEMARTNGIEEMVLYPRLGWLAELGLKPSDGWVEVHRVFNKRVS